MRKLRGLWKIVFGRTTMLVLLLFIQALVLFGGFVILGRQVLMLNYMSGFLAVMILMYILNVKQNSSFKLMWIIFILVVPIILPALQAVNRCRAYCIKSEKTENRLYRKSLYGYGIPQAFINKFQLIFHIF